MPRPSFGCLACRRRRIRCDERAGGCANCERYRIVCPGYPEAFDVLHRQHQTIASVNASRSRTPTRPEATAERPRMQQLESAGPSRGPSVDNDEITLGVYYTSYCIEGGSRWSLDELRQQGSGCLLAAVKLMGLQVMSRKWDVFAAETQLQRYYATAISLLNASLASETERQKDSTLMTTVLMAAIETKACTDHSTRAWEAHSIGAAALLQVRGAAQVTSHLESALFFQTTYQIFTSCLIGKCRVPAGFVKLNHSMEQYVTDSEHPLWRYHWLMIRFIDFLADMPEDLQALLGDQEAREQVVVQATAIQDDARRLFDNAPAPWQYQLVHSAEFPDVTFQAHVYASIAASQMWNGRRIIILKTSEILRQLAHAKQTPEVGGDASLAAQIAVQTMNQTALDCIEAAPQVLEVSRARMSQCLLRPEYQVCHDAQLASFGCFVQLRSNEQKLPYLQGCLLQWSIFFAAQIECIQPRVRRCLLGILDYAGGAMQMQQWKVLADRVRPLLV